MYRASSFLFLFSFQFLSLYRTNKSNVFWVGPKRICQQHLNYLLDSSDMQTHRWDCFWILLLCRQEISVRRVLLFMVCPFDLSVLLLNYLLYVGNNCFNFIFNLDIIYMSGSNFLTTRIFHEGN